MTEADIKFDPIKAFNNATGRKSYNALNIPFNAKTPYISPFDVKDDKAPGIFFFLKKVLFHKFILQALLIIHSKRNQKVSDVKVMLSQFHCDFQMMTNVFQGLLITM